MTYKIKLKNFNKVFMGHGPPARLARYDWFVGLWAMLGHLFGLHGLTQYYF